MQPLKYELACVAAPTMLSDFILLCINIDTHLVDRQQNHWNSQGERNYHQAEGSISEPSSLELMQVDGSHHCLTSTEKQCHCDQGLCLYCGNQGHFADACPAKVQPAGNGATQQL
ncbi:hypothetical protein JRQ81_012550 [Phrynocephalus forsythii]|uniref:CCHC-type domain-containing protein n=1 Tax=Phrynocephalus forsythii TaxID=171643 RepID=A0A9Q1B5D8_9SAUR|nr:hypothetical protein JRQ81_012550 [Phrynocephalus forsythii]